MLIATLKVLLSDGSRWELGTDEAWRVTRGAVGYDSVFNGKRDGEGGLDREARVMVGLPYRFLYDRSRCRPLSGSGL